MIDYELFQFAAAPGTGVCDFTNACRIVGLGEHLKVEAYEPWAEKQKPGELRVTLVRHPFNWFRCIYNELKIRSLPKVLELNNLDHSGSFLDFLQDYLRYTPGELTRLFRSYDVGVVHKAEDFPHSFIEFGKSLETPSNSLAYLNKLRGENNYLFYQIPEYMKHLLRQCDKEIFDEYDYW